MKNYYNILEVDEDSSREEIKKSYRRKAKQFHPDTNRDNPDAEKKFKEISEAYEILSNDTKRQQYENRRHGGFTNPFNMHHSSSNDNIFESIFNNMGNRRTQQVNRDSSINLTISIEQAFSGIKKNIRYNKTVICKDCNGSGSEGNKERAKCYDCNGTGSIEQSLHSFMRFSMSCEKCNGTGFIIKNICKKCSGNGYKIETVEKKINIPSGTRPNIQIRIKNEGNEYQKGKFGDIIIFVQMYRHNFYNIKNNDIYVNYIIPFHIYLTGGIIEIPTLHGVEKVSMNKKNQNNMRIKSKGFPLRNGSKEFGDQIVMFEIEIPEKIPEEIVKKMKELMNTGKETYPNYNVLLDKNRI